MSRGRCGCGRARTLASRFARAGTSTGAELDLDGAVLLDVAAQQRQAEAAPTSVLDVTAPTEAATALAFGHTATVADRPGNEAPLREVGALFGRLAHLLDAVEDLRADDDAGAWNPISTLGLPPERVRSLCDDALLGIELALRDVSFTDRRLVHMLLVHELQTAVERTFTRAGAPGQPPPAGWEAPPPAKRPNPVQGCVGWVVLCGTCQVCCAGEWVNPCTNERHEGACRGDCLSGCDTCDCDGCGDCCDCCDCSC